MFPFCVIVLHLHAYVARGFTKGDAETYRYVFLMFDHDHSGDMNTRELMSALGQAVHSIRPETHCPNPRSRSSVDKLRA